MLFNKYIFSDMLFDFTVVEMYPFPATMGT